MHHEHTTILYLCDMIDPSFKKAFINFGQHFKVNHITAHENLDFHLQISKNSIFICDKKTFSGLITSLKKNKKSDILKNSAIIGVGSDLFEIIEVEWTRQKTGFFQVLTDPLELKQIENALFNAFTFITNRKNIQNLQQKLKVQSQEMRELNDIGIALSAERDPDSLLEMILIKSREITMADAGSLYLVEKKDGVEEDEKNYFANKQLRFKLAQNDSVPVDFTESVMPIEAKSIAGHVALTSDILNIPDVYELPENSDIKHNRSFDDAVGYRTTSMLVIPMKNHKDEIIGVLQLINRKRKWGVLLTSAEIVQQEVIVFDEKCVDLASSLASQAAVSIENSRLYEEIKNLFEGFIKASVHAIEQRDPTTFGHSERVATLTTAIAKKVDRVSTGKFKSFRFSRDDIQQINYAALLHDFGKIGVREDILIKAKKLFPFELDAVKNRFRIFSQATELNHSNEKIELLLKLEKEQALTRFKSLDNKTKEKLVALDNYLNAILEINEPTVMKESGFEILNEIAKIIFEDNGRPEKLLKEEEIERLSIARGSLSNDERVEIESHVTHTFNFLRKIPWTKELKNIPQIAYAHHEKLDGSGYPRGLKAPDIPIQSQMMVIADIYDALTAWDRPYKKAVPEDRALDILGYEVKEGKIDAELFKLFVDAKLYELVKKPEHD